MGHDLHRPCAPWRDNPLGRELRLSRDYVEVGTRGFFAMPYRDAIVAVCAIAREPKLGIDVEYIRPMSDLESIAKQFFSAAEYDDLVALDVDQRCEGFFNCWTRKEAYIKAIGDGLYAPLDQFQVTLRPGQQAAFITIQGNGALASEWSLFHWKPKEQYAGAVAVYRKEWFITERPIELLNL